MRTQHRGLRAPALALGLLGLGLIGTSPAAGVVVFEPTRQPPPERWLAEVPLVVDWADVSMRLPTAWDAKVKRAPLEGASGASLMVAFGPGDSVCLLDMYGSAVESWQDVGVSAAAELTIDGATGNRSCPLVIVLRRWFIRTESGRFLSKCSFIDAVTIDNPR